MKATIKTIIAFACMPLIFPAGAAADKVLFIRGASGTVGFTEGGSDEQGASIDNFLTTQNNHGWGELSAALLAEGFELKEIVEGAKDPSG